MGSLRKLEITVVGISIIVIAASFWVLCRVSVLLLIEHRRLLMQYGQHSENTLHFPQ